MQEVLKKTKSGEDAQKLKALIGHYREFLLHQINGTPFVRKGEIKNPFDPNPERGESIYKNHVLLPSLNKSKSQLPLAFPQELLKHLDFRFGLRGLSGDDDASYTAIPSYSFMLKQREELGKDQECYELAIEYRLMKHHTDPEPKEYCSFVIAQFGAETVDAFREKIPPEEGLKDLFYNEFLIQMMYSQTPIKLPGAKSFRLLKTGRETVIPIEGEEAFNALYPQLIDKEFSGQRAIFNKDSYVQEIKAGVESDVAKFLEAETGLSTAEKERLKKKLVKHHENLHLGIIQDRKEDSRRIEDVRRASLRADIAELKKTHVYREAKKYRLLLQALLKITTDADLSMSLNPYGPDPVVENYKVVADILKRQEDNACPFDEALKSIEEAYDNHPSDERQRLENHLRNLETIRRLSAEGGPEGSGRLLAILDGKTAFSDYHPLNRKGAR